MGPVPELKASDGHEGHRSGGELVGWWHCRPRMLFGCFGDDGQGGTSGGFADVEAVGDAAREFGDMTDDADSAVVGAQGVQGVEDVVEGVFVEGAKASVDEESTEGLSA